MQNDIGFVMTSVTTIMLVAITFAVAHTVQNKFKIYAMLSWFAILLADIEVNMKYPIHTGSLNALVTGFKGLVKSPTDLFCLILIIIIGIGITSAILIHSRKKKNSK